MITPRTAEEIDRAINDSHLGALPLNLETAIDELVAGLGSPFRRAPMMLRNKLALKNSTTSKDELIELLEMAIPHIEDAVDSLALLEEGMLAADAEPIFGDAILSLAKGDLLIKSAIEALEAFEDGGDEGDDGGDSDGIFGCSSVGIPQTKAMSKLMNKLRERIESNRFAGQQYIELYYKNIKELTQIVNSHPALASRLVSERTRLMPSILLLIFGEHAVFSKTDVKRIELILDAIHAYASPQLGNR